jgi:subtilase family serine protease
MIAPSKAGAFTSQATVDPYGEIVESNEANNRGTVGFGVNEQGAFHGE